MPVDVERFTRLHRAVLAHFASSASMKALVSHPCPSPQMLIHLPTTRWPCLLSGKGSAKFKYHLRPSPISFHITILLRTTSLSITHSQSSAYHLSLPPLSLPSILFLSSSALTERGSSQSQQSRNQIPGSPVGHTDKAKISKITDDIATTVDKATLCITSLRGGYLLPIHSHLSEVVRHILTYVVVWRLWCSGAGIQTYMHRAS